MNLFHLSKLQKDYRVKLLNFVLGKQNKQLKMFMIL